jgi:prophage regulatory protein
MRVLRKAEVLRITGLSASTIARLEERGKFPGRLRLGSHAVGWRAEEIEEWISRLRRCCPAPSNGRGGCLVAQAESE